MLLNFLPRISFNKHLWFQLCSLGYPNTHLSFWTQNYDTKVLHFLQSVLKRSYLLFVSAGLIWHHIHRPPNVLNSQFWVRSVLIEYHYDQTAAASFCNRRISPLINIKRVFNKRPYWLLAVVQSKRASNQLKLGTQWQRQQNVALLPLRNNYICFLFIFEYSYLWWPAFKYHDVAIIADPNHLYFTYCLFLQ